MPSARAAAIARFSRDRSFGDRPSMLSSRGTDRVVCAGVDLVGVVDGFLDGDDDGLVGGSDGIGVLVAGGGPTAGALTDDTTGDLSAARPSISPTCACHSSSDPTTAPTATPPITDSDRVRAVPVRRRRKSLMGYSLSDRHGWTHRSQGPFSRPFVAPE